MILVGCWPCCYPLKCRSYSSLTFLDKVKGLPKNSINMYIYSPHRMDFHVSVWIFVLFLWIPMHLCRIKNKRCVLNIRSLKMTVTEVVTVVILNDDLD